MYGRRLFERAVYWEYNTNDPLGEHLIHWTLALILIIYGTEN